MIIQILLRADNADERLTRFGHDLGLVCEVRWEAWVARANHLEEIRYQMKELKLGKLVKKSDTPIVEIVSKLPKKLDPRLIRRVVSDVRYEGYIVRQHAEIKRQEKTEGRKIPQGLDPSAISGLRNEAIDVLNEFKPSTLGQASRLAGITPADITLISIAIRRINSNSQTE